MVQAGAAPVTWPQVVLEFRRGRARREAAMEVQEVAVEQAGAYVQRMRYVLGMSPWAAGLFEEPPKPSGRIPKGE